MIKPNLFEEWDISNMETYLMKMIKKGYEVKRVNNYFMVFTKVREKRVIYRIDCMKEYYMDDVQYYQDLEERKRVFKEAGWNYVTGYGKIKEMEMNWMHIYQSYLPDQMFPGDREEYVQCQKDMLFDERKKIKLSCLLNLILLVIFIVGLRSMRGFFVQLFDGIGVMSALVIVMAGLELITNILALIRINSRIIPFGSEELKNICFQNKRIETRLRYIKIINNAVVMCCLFLISVSSMLLCLPSKLHEKSYLMAERSAKELRAHNVHTHIYRQSSLMARNHYIIANCYDDEKESVITEIYQLRFQNLTRDLARDSFDLFSNGGKLEYKQINSDRGVYMKYHNNGVMVMYDENIVIIIRNYDMKSTKKEALSYMNRIMDRWTANK
ncbi:hypothetical protein lbkm_2047 [Lachnospiraceae bacterium KM106-2]|nr:hypothetical protein lbkm_2047 [Lachnospiraceae bacterium KM106-2]